MATQFELVLEFIMKDVTAPICTRCLVTLAGIADEKRGRQICRNLRDEGWIQRGPGECRRCGVRFPQVNFPLSSAKLPTNPRPIVPMVNDHTWHWEGNVQDALIGRLTEQGWTIVSAADTASHERGKDIVALSSDGQEMWVSVKGYPEKRPGKTTSPSTQAKHWFSQAIFDMVRYREESPNVLLAMALPDGFVTYDNQMKKVRWFKKVTPFRLYWISESGRVREE